MSTARIHSTLSEAGAITIVGCSWDAVGADYQEFGNIGVELQPGGVGDPDSHSSKGKGSTAKQWIAVARVAIPLTATFRGRTDGIRSGVQEAVPGMASLLGSHACRRGPSPYTRPVCHCYPSLALMHFPIEMVSLKSASSSVTASRPPSPSRALDPRPVRGLGQYCRRTRDCGYGSKHHYILATN